MFRNCDPVTGNSEVTKISILREDLAESTKPITEVAYDDNTTDRLVKFVVCIFVI